MPNRIPPRPLRRGVGAVLWLTALLAASFCPPRPAAAAAGAPPRVDNAAGPARPDVDRTLTEQWRRGDEDDELFFGLIPAAVPAAGGGLHVLDAQLSTVYHLSDEGVLLGNLGREGEGPGEFQRAGTLIALPDGILGVVQRFPGRIVKLNPDGTPAGVVLPGDPTTGGRDMLSAGAVTGAGLVLSGAHMTRNGDARLRRNFISLYEDDTASVEYVGADDTMEFTARSFREADQDFPGEDRWLALPDGRVVVALSRDDYLLTMFAPDGAPVLAFGRPAEPARRDDAELARLRAQWEAGRRFQRFGTEQVFAETHPMVHDMALRGDEIWVLPHAGAASGGGVLQTWDVFTLDGRWDRRERLHAPGDGLRDRLIFLDGDRALLVGGFRDALESMFGTGGEAEAEADAAPVRITLYRLD